MYSYLVMVLEDSKIYKFHHKHQKFIHGVTGVLIIILLIGLWVMYFNSSKLQKEISENCGWSGEDYECYCQKDKALALKNKLQNRDIDIVVERDGVVDVLR